MEWLYRNARAPRSNERVLLWVPGGMPGMLQVEGAIAAALKLRGVGVHAILCDGPFIGCVLRELRDQVPMSRWHDRCKGCKAATTAELDRIGIPYSYIGDFVPSEVRSRLREEASRVTWDNLKSLPVGANVRSSITRFLKGVPITGHEEVVPEYAYSALVCASAAEAAIQRLQPSHVFMSHGVYVDWGPALAVAHRNGIPVSAWMASYLDNHFYFRHIRDPLHVYNQLGDEAWSELSALELTPLQEASLDRYLTRRYRNKINFDLRQLADYSGDVAALKAKYVPGARKPTWAIMAHVNWDAVFDGAPMAYPVFNDWITDTLTRISPMDHVNWLFKVHPAEAWENPDTGVNRLIQARFPNLPPHIRVIAADEPISPLDLYQLVDGVVTVYGTAGLEMALMGKPAIVAGEAHYGGRGFTHDATSRDTYRDLLARVGNIGPISESQVGLARKYAYTYFIRQQIPLPAVDDPLGWWRFQIRDREALVSGSNAFLDLVCERLLDGSDFVMSDQLVAGSGVLDGLGVAPTAHGE